MDDREHPGYDDTGRHPLFPQERTFVVRFDRTTDLAAGRCAGKVEQVASSARRSFADLGELLEHLRKLIE